jgi:hypothetical protein
MTAVNPQKAGAHRPKQGPSLETNCKDVHIISIAGGQTMILKQPLDAQRIRKISGSFAFIEHRFLRDGFWAGLSHHELLLYMFLVLVSDRKGLSYYAYDKICTLLRICVDDYIVARDGLINKDLLAFDGYLYQVLALPETLAAEPNTLLKSQQDMVAGDPATIGRMIKTSLAGKHA